jgi:hypothetical protein
VRDDDRRHRRERDFIHLDDIGFAVALDSCRANLILGMTNSFTQSALFFVKWSWLEDALTYLLESILNIDEEFGKLIHKHVNKILN